MRPQPVASRVSLESASAQMERHADERQQAINLRLRKGSEAGLIQSMRRKSRQRRAPAPAKRPMRREVSAGFAGKTKRSEHIDSGGG